MTAANSGTAMPMMLSSTKPPRAVALAPRSIQKNRVPIRNSLGVQRV